jgi:hypothetical protein
MDIIFAAAMLCNSWTLTGFTEKTPFKLLIVNNNGIVPCLTSLLGVNVLCQVCGWRYFLKFANFVNTRHEKVDRRLVCHN